MQEVNWFPVKPTEFKEGMVVFREPRYARNSSTVITKYKGQCDQGLHFGSACFGRISTWWVPQVAKG